MIGNENEPGITSSVTSAQTLASGEDSAGVALLVGEADLSNGNASANEVYSAANVEDARRLFGDSHLTRNIADALAQGASPVLGVAPAKTDKTEDISSLGSASGTISEPAVHDPETITVTVDSESKTVHLSLEDLESASVSSGNVLLNPGTDEFKLDSSPSSSGSIEYSALDYTAALDAVGAYEEEVDFVAVCKERSSIVDHLLTTVNEMESNAKLALGLAGVEAPVDATSFSHSYDDSRLQLFAPARHSDYTSMIGAYAGMRANIGLTTTAINQSLVLRDRPHRSLDSSERGNLIDENVTPAETVGKSARVADDITTVTTDNSDEQNYRWGFSRLVVDFVIDTLHEMEQPYVGKFNAPGVIGQLEDLLNKEARPLEQSNVVYSFNASVEMNTATDATVIFNADVAEPIQSINNEIVIGNDLSVQNEA